MGFFRNSGNSAGKGEQEDDLAELNEQISGLLKNKSRILQKLESLGSGYGEKKATQKRGKDFGGNGVQKAFQEIHYPAASKPLRLKRPIVSYSGLLSALSELKEDVWKDFIKGAVGALVGIVSHLTFLDYFALHSRISSMGAAALLLASAGAALFFIYLPGPRKTSGLNPVLFASTRASVVFLVSMALISVFFIMQSAFWVQAGSGQLFRQAAAANLFAMLGAGLAGIFGER